MFGAGQIMRQTRAPSLVLYGMGLWRIKAGGNRDVEVVVTETVGEACVVANHLVLMHIFTPFG